MSLMFPRIAHNFAKNGYYPTDEGTLERVLAMLRPAEGPMRIIDPCAGEGVALAECKHRLGADLAEAIGVEYDEERAWHAKQLLDVAIHADLQDCVIEKRRFGLMWFNPPYGDGVTDRAGVSGQSKRIRLEKLFYQQCNALLQFGGVMVALLPNYVLDAELSKWIASHFERVQVYQAMDRTFKQVVIIAVRRRATGGGRAAAMKLLEQAREGDVLALPETPTEEEIYSVPASRGGELKLFKAQLDAAQLAHDVIGASEGDSVNASVYRRTVGLWSQFEMEFGRIGRPVRRPAMPPSKWHQSLSLAAGEIAGVVKSRDGLRWAVKGATYKSKAVQVVRDVTEKGDLKETQIRTDVFVPVIRAIDLTEGSDRFGDIITIR